MTHVKVGQVWKDYDVRARHHRDGDARYIQVLKVWNDLGLAVCASWRGYAHKAPATFRRVEIRLDRFKPNSTGYQLVPRPR